MSVKNNFRPFQAIVKKIKKETYDVNTYTLSLDNTKDFSPEPGQFNMFSIPGIGEAPISFSSEVYNDNLFDHTIRNVGRVTNSIFKLKTATG